MNSHWRIFLVLENLALALAPSRPRSCTLTRHTPFGRMRRTSRWMRRGRLGACSVQPHKSLNKRKDTMATAKWAPSQPRVRSPRVRPHSRARAFARRVRQEKAVHAVAHTSARARTRTHARTHARAHARTHMRACCIRLRFCQAGWLSGFFVIFRESRV